MNIHFVLTTFAPAMFGSAATVHMRIIDETEARGLVDDRTRIVATRATHEALARNLLPACAADTARYAQLLPGINAIHVAYRGPPIDNDGSIPPGGNVVLTLIEVEGYQSG